MSALIGRQCNVPECFQYQWPVGWPVVFAVRTGQCGGKGVNLRTGGNKDSGPNVLVRTG